MRPRCGVVLALLGLSMLVGMPSAAGAVPPGTPAARHFAGIPTVGAVFPAGLALPHTCTAGVLDSPHGDLILTAAHCVVGAPFGWRFAPGYVNGRTPYGVWTITAAYLDQRWITNKDSGYDYAILRVAPRKFGRHWLAIQDVTAGIALGTAPRPGSTITDVAYNLADSAPITCTTEVYETAGYPSFNCSGYTGGSSGSPWLQHRGRQLVVTGVIGGLHQGGCYDYTSYSSPFTTAVYGLFHRAATHARPDIAPVAGSDGC